MNSKLIAILAWAVIGGAAMSGNLAYAAMDEYMSSRACEDWSFNDPNCPAFLAPSMTTEGKPAFGTPSTGMEALEGRGCEDWSFNDSNCSAYIDRTAGAGKAAFGIPSGEISMPADLSLSCEDWSFNDSRCAAYIR